ncbi:hypothetical protein SAMN04488499_100461 [Sporomusa acidovorans]|nr:hypothetical protein SAMN04488499_100461 [Sporomusa acidovorans]
MLWKRALAVGLLLGALTASVQAAPSDFVSPNVPLSSPLYGYIEKFDGWVILNRCRPGLSLIPGCRWLSG